MSDEKLVKLDGSLGLKDRVIITLITRDDIEGELKESFLFPKALVDFSALNACVILNIIKGVTVVNQDKKEDAEDSNG